MVDIDKVIAWESGELCSSCTVELFAGLVRSGAAWQLQGSYGRTANELIAGGLISDDGTNCCHVRECECNPAELGRLF
jgi:hypothetical protein